MLLFKISSTNIYFGQLYKSKAKCKDTCRQASRNIKVLQKISWHYSTGQSYSASALHNLSPRSEITEAYQHWRFFAGMVDQTLSAFSVLHQNTKTHFEMNNVAAVCSSFKDKSKVTQLNQLFDDMQVLGFQGQIALFLLHAELMTTTCINIYPVW